MKSIERKIVEKKNNAKALRKRKEKPPAHLLSIVLVLTSPWRIAIKDQYYHQSVRRCCDGSDY